MNVQDHLLSDEHIQQFLRDGYVAVRTGVPEALHQSICSQMDDLLASEPNPGNNLLPRIPEIGLVFEDDVVGGALESILGPNYQMEDHRYVHVNKPRSEPQKIHKDGGRRGDHRVRRVLVLYYPQDTPETLGPTGVLPGSQYFNERPDDIPVVPLIGDAGVVVIAHYEIWHLATANGENRPRYMMKFQFTRTEEPCIPSWDVGEPVWDTDQQMLQSIWRWHLGTAPTSSLKSMKGNGEGAERSVALESLNDRAEAVRNEAAYCLAALTQAAEGNGGDSEAILDDLVSVLRGPSAPAAQSAAYGLAAVGETAVDRLIPLMGDADSDTRRYATHALGEMGTGAARAEPSLRRTLEDDDPGIRTLAANALGNCQGSKPDLTVQALMKTFNDPDKRMRRAADGSVARLTGRLAGSASSEVVRGLKAALSNDNRYVRGLAAKALERIGTPEAFEIVIGWLHASRWCPLTTAKSPY